MKLKVNSSLVKEDEGIVYVLVLYIEEKEIVKIGVTSRLKVEERVSEILVSIWKKYREFPRCKVKRFSKTTDIYSKENTLHKMFDSHRYTTEHVFSGSTECFDVPLDVVVDEYDKLLGKKHEDKSKVE